MSELKGTTKQAQYKPWVSPAMPPVLGSLGRIFGFAALAILSAGLAFEFEYFRGLTLWSFDYLGPAHFFMSGLLIIWLPVAILTVWAMAKKLFSPAITADDWAEVRETMSKSSFTQEVWLARFAVVFALIQYLSTKFDLLHLGPSSVFAMYVVSILFVRAALLAPGPARMPLFFWFFISWMACAAAGGAYQARVDAGQSVIRDDKVVKIERRSDHYVVFAKPQDWTSLPLVSPLLRHLGAVAK